MEEQRVRSTGSNVLGNTWRRPVCPFFNLHRNYIMDNVISMKEAQMEKFVRRLLDPEGFGHAVTAEVRDEARVLLGMKKVETVKIQCL